MMEKIVSWIFPLKSGFGIGYSIGPKVLANLGFGIGPKPKQWFQPYTTLDSLTDSSKFKRGDRNRPEINSLQNVDKK